MVREEAACQMVQTDGEKMGQTQDRYARSGTQQSEQMILESTPGPASRSGECIRQ